MTKIFAYQSGLSLSDYGGNSGNWKGSNTVALTIGNRRSIQIKISEIKGDLIFSMMCWTKSERINSGHIRNYWLQE